MNLKRAGQPPSSIERVLSIDLKKMDVKEEADVSL
jgi:hypothetical protein